MTEEVVRTAGDREEGAVDGTEERLQGDFEPWAFWERATPDQRADQERRLEELRARGYRLGERCVVSRFAVVTADELTLGERSTVAAHVHVSGEVTVGDDSSVNVGSAVRGRVTVGRAVRIGSGTSLLGFDHGFDRTDVEVFRQPLTSQGVSIGDDVWIGSHVVVVDGVTIGDHAVVGAGSVVTRDVPAWAVAAGNPARVVRDRRAGVRDRGGPTSAESMLRDLGEQARDDATEILERSFREGTYRDRDDRSPTVRAHADAVELADLLLGTCPPQLSAQEHVVRLRGLQDAVTGLVAELTHDGRPGPVRSPVRDARGWSPANLPDATQAYHVLSAGYALDLLGSGFAHPVHAVTALTPAELVRLLEVLPWDADAWGAGAVVDAVGTALTWALRGGHPVHGGVVDALLGRLVRLRDRSTGLWGLPTASGLREPVNATYRLVRGTLAQWGVALDADALLVDTVLRRAGEPSMAGSTACDPLDVLHLLWWSRRDLPGGGAQREHEVREVAHRWAEHVASAWVPGEGVPFAPGSPPSLQGTEMWLAVAWYAADLLGLAGALGYRPRGVHRPEPALRLPLD